MRRSAGNLPADSPGVAAISTATVRHPHTAAATMARRTLRLERPTSAPGDLPERLGRPQPLDRDRPPVVGHARESTVPDFSRPPASRAPSRPH